MFKSQLSSARDVLLSSLAGYCISHLVCGPVMFRSQLSSARDVLLSSLAGYCISHLVCGPVSVGLVRRKQILTARSGSGSKQNCARLSLRNCSHIAGTLHNPERAYCWDVAQPRNSILLGRCTTQKQQIAGILHNPETAYCWDLTQPRNSILLGRCTTQKQHIAGTLHNPETAYCRVSVM